MRANIYGSKHLFTARINYNEGIAYEKEGKYREAYECFKTSYLIGKEIFGPKHDRTKKYIRTLNEFRYKGMAIRRRISSFDGNTGNESMKIMRRIG